MILYCYTYSFSVILNHVHIESIQNNTFKNLLIKQDCCGTGVSKLKFQWNTTSLLVYILWKAAFAL